MSCRQSCEPFRRCHRLWRETDRFVRPAADGSRESAAPKHANGSSWSSNRERLCPQDVGGDAEAAIRPQGQRLQSAMTTTRADPFSRAGLFLKPDYMQHVHAADG